MKKAISLVLHDVELQGDLILPDKATGLVIFAHGSGSSRHSPRNRFVAGRINEAGVGTLLMDLLTVDEERVDEFTRELRFDITLLAKRVAQTVGWVRCVPELEFLKIGLFGSSTGAAAALVAAAELPSGEVQAIVSRGGRPDLAGSSLSRVKCPTLLLVGGEDTEVIALNEQARDEMRCDVKLMIVPGATHLFEEPGTLETVADLAAAWFCEKFRSDDSPAAKRRG